MLTAHATERMRQRLGVCPDEALMLRLWQAGREAARSDFAFYNSCPMDGCVYRVAVFKGHKWLISRDAITGDFVTIFRRK